MNFEKYDPGAHGQMLECPRRAHFAIALIGGILLVIAAILIFVGVSSSGSGTGGYVGGAICGLFGGLLVFLFIRQRKNAFIYNGFVAQLAHNGFVTTGTVSTTRVTGQGVTMNNSRTTEKAIIVGYAYTDNNNRVRNGSGRIMTFQQHTDTRTMVGGRIGGTIGRMRETQHEWAAQRASRDAQRQAIAMRGGQVRIAFNDNVSVILQVIDRNNNEGVRQSGNMMGGGGGPGLPFGGNRNPNQGGGGNNFGGGQGGGGTNFGGGNPGRDASFNQGNFNQTQNQNQNQNNFSNQNNQDNWNNQGQDNWNNNNQDSWSNQNNQSGGGNFSNPNNFSGENQNNNSNFGGDDNRF